MMRPAPVWLLFAALTWMPAAVGQTTLGALLDAGATRLSAAQFREYIEQRMVAGPLPTGGDMEVMYATNGAVAGTGKNPAFFGPHATLRGEWKFDDAGRVCSSIRIGGNSLPYRCQSWFKLGDKYYICDSDTDRSAKVLVRTIKQ